MAEDPAAEQETRQLEDRLREVGERLQAPPDDAEDLLNLLIEVEECLLKVEQSPPESTSNALQLATAALVRKSCWPMLIQILDLSCHHAYLRSHGSQRQMLHMMTMQ